MIRDLHPAAPQHIPWFISGPHEGDVLYVITTISVIAAILGIGILFFTLHSLPERLGHKKLQFEIVAVLGLLSLFTHVHAFWVAGLLLALVDLPDFVSPLKRIAGALEKHVGIDPQTDGAVQKEGPSGSDSVAPAAGAPRSPVADAPDSPTVATGLGA